MTDKDETAPGAVGDSLPTPITRGIPAGAGRVMFVSAILLVPVFAACWLLERPEIAKGVFGGGVVAIANFWLLARIVVSTTGGEDQDLATMMGRLFAKFLVLGASLGFLVGLLRLDGLGVLLGVGVVFPAIVLASIWDGLN